MPQSGLKPTLYVFALAACSVTGVALASPGGARQSKIEDTVFTCYKRDGAREVTSINRPGCIQLSPNIDVERLRSRSEALRYAQAKVSYNLPDPEATRFRQLYLTPDGKHVCGQFNSKNLAGAYKGYANFAVLVDPAAAQRGLVDTSARAGMQCAS